MTAPAERRWWAALALLIGGACLAYLYVWWPMIAAWGFPDPDDQMRLQQVRDWLGGQAWRDVSQHRMNAPWGAPMHWSRLVDLPLAGVMLALRPLVGAAQAEWAAVLIVPALTLAAAMALAALLGRRLLGPVEGLAAALLLPLTSGATQQLRPLRVDHHGWQMVLALGLVLALLDRRRARGGVVAGLCAAAWLTISLEGLPFCAAVGALAALRWWLDRPGDGGRFAGYAVSLAGSTLCLFAATRPAAAWQDIACDAISPVHLAILGLTALGAIVTTRLANRWLALAVLAGAGAGALLLYVGLAPQCTRGAFAALDPLSYRFWYLNVREGLPVWRLQLPIALSAVGFPIVALVGTVMARGVADRRAWLDHALLLLAATLVAAAVQRAGAVANVLALPAGVALMRQALARIERLKPGMPRVAGGVAGLGLLLPPAPALAAAALERLWPEEAAGGVASRCATSHDFAALNRLPASSLMTNVDIGPGILFATPHRIVASGHHRNVRGIHDAIATFVGSPATARAIMAVRRIDYLVVCADQAELAMYAEASPHGFWAQLTGGRRFDWAVPVTVPGTRLSVWRIAGR